MITTTKLRVLVKGIATWIPGTSMFRSNTAGATESARYCYSVWLRHVVMAKGSGLNPYPPVVAELGPGSSLGVGIAALVSGCDRYVGLDVAAFAAQQTNLTVFDELVTLFRNRTDIPRDDEFPQLRPRLDSYEFPHHVFDKDHLDRALNGSRLATIRQWMGEVNGKGSHIKYVAPWYDRSVIEEDSVDLVLSQAALEHVDDLAETYRAMAIWLKPTGFVSHTIDYKCHGTADEWNGHWTYSDLEWRLMKGNRTYFLNREPHSTHIALLRQEGYTIACEKRFRSESFLARDALARRYGSMSEEDFTTSEAFIQATKLAEQ